jgi:RNA polymerase sigma factor for flagellar operon FliA
MEAGLVAERWSQFRSARTALREVETAAQESPTPQNERLLREARARLVRARNRLAELYLPLVRQVADRVRTRLPQGVELEDLLAEGVFGLMEAIEGFDELRGFRFETFAPRRVRGAILDYLRSIDWVPRLVRSRWREVQAVIAEFAKLHGRQPTDEEVIERLDDPVPGRIFADGRVVTMNPLIRRDRDTGEPGEGTFADQIGDPRVENPFTAAHRRQIKEYLLRSLSRIERLIVILNYYEGLTLAEVGKVLDISESRVSQLRTSILERLRSRLDKAEATRLMTPEAALR